MIVTLIEELGNSALVWAGASMRRLRAHLSSNLHRLPALDRIQSIQTFRLWHAAVRPDLGRAGQPNTPTGVFLMIF